MKQSEKCEDCAKSWKNKHKVTTQELMIAIEDCKVCFRNNFLLYIKSIGGGSTGKENKC